jgi:hypothetical protein
MISRQYSLTELCSLIQNKDNPKTMDYYFNRMLNVFSYDEEAGHNTPHIALTYGGVFDVVIHSRNPTLSNASCVLKRGSNKNNNMLFVMRLFENHLFPKSKTFRVISRSTCPVNIINPLAGQVSETKYASGYVYRTVQEPTVLHPKPLVLYSKNNWQRKGILNIEGSTTDNA